MAKCFYHKRRDVVGACVNCGRLICADCEVTLKGKIYCNPCVEVLFGEKETAAASAPAKEVAQPPPRAPKKAVAAAKAEVAAATTADNTSGQGKGAVIPPEIRGWNWGAFLLNWMWGIGNKVGIALLTFILGPIMAIILGVKGNEWAWRNKKWKSVEKFKKTQRGWAGAGIGLTCVSILLVIVMIVSISGQGTDWRADGAIQEPLTMNTEEQIDEKTINSFIESDSLEMLMSSTPYYLGSADSSQPGISEYRKLKSKKVTEAISLTQNLFVTLQDLKNDLEIYRSAYLDFIDIAMAEEPGLQQFSYDVAALEVKYLAREASLIAAIEGFDTATISDEFVSSFFEYQKTALVLDLARMLYEHLGYILSNSLQLSVVFENTSNPTIHEALADYESQLNKISQLNDLLTGVNKTSLLLSTVLKQIYTGDYYIGLGSLAYMKNNIEQVKQAASTLQTSEYLDEEGIQFIHDYIDVFESVNTSLAEIMGNVDKKNLLADLRRMDDFTLFTPVYADDEVNNNFSSAFSALNADTDSAAALSLGTGEATSYLSWKGVKAAAAAAQKVVGMGLDSLSAVSKIPFDAACTLYEGNTLKDLGDQVGSNFIRAGNNYMTGMSGVDTLNVAKKTFDTLENWGEAIGEEAVGYPVEKIFGKGTYADNAPWLAGAIAKFGVSCFTGFGKGIYQVANQKSSNATLAEGALNIGLSFVGGSKTILPASAALKGTASGAKILYEKGINFVKKTIVNYEEKGASETAKALLEKEGGELLTNINDIRKIKSMQAVLKEGEEQTAKKLDDLVNAAKEDIKAIPGRGYEAFADLVNKEYAFTLEGIKNAVKDTIGKSPVEFMDNFLGSTADGVAVDWIKSLFVSQGITLSGDLAKNTSGTTTDTNTNTMVVNGAIHIVSTPPGADIWLDNSKESLQTPNTLHEITPGDHKVVLKIPGGYQDYARTVSVIAGQTAQISAKLEPLPAATGNLRIASDQSDATIVIDGTTQDVKTPASFKNVPVGSYKITVKKVGFQDYSERVDVEPMQERQVWAPLKPLQLAKGTLNIGSEPAGADIYIDGQKQGSQTPANYIVEPRTYTVVLKKAGYKDFSATATVAEGRITEMLAKLEAVESTPAPSQQPVPTPETEPAIGATRQLVYHCGGVSSSPIESTYTQVWGKDQFYGELQSGLGWQNCGPYTEYYCPPYKYPNGDHIYETGTYINNVWEGTRQRYREDGTHWETFEYVNGEIVNTIYYGEDGRPY